MRRTVAPFALVLALTTGAAIAETRHAFLAPAALGQAGGDAATEALVRRFYLAVNDALAIGDFAPVRDLLDADFVDHTPLPGVAPDRDGFIQSLLALRSTAPTLRLTVLDLLTQNDRAMTRLRVERLPDLTIPDHPAAAIRLWSPVDLLRVEAGRIVERWADATGLAHVEPLLATTVPIEQIPRTVLALERWEYASGVSESRVSATSVLVVVVERGNLTMTTAAASVDAARLVPAHLESTPLQESPVAPGETAILGPGDALVVPLFGHVELRNDGPERAVALAVLTETIDASWARPAYPDLAIPAIGTDHVELTAGVSTKITEKRTNLTIHRIALAPGAVLPPHRDGVSVLLAVESGALNISAVRGTVWAKPEPASGTQFVQEDKVEAGGGVLIKAETAANLQVAGEEPAEFVLVSFSAVVDTP